MCLNCVVDHVSRYALDSLRGRDIRPLEDGLQQSGGTAIDGTMLQGNVSALKIVCDKITHHPQSNTRILCNFMQKHYITWIGQLYAAQTSKNTRYTNALARRKK